MGDASQISNERREAIVVLPGLFYLSQPSARYADPPFAAAK